MAAQTTLSDLRNGIEDIYLQVMRGESNGEASNSAVLARVKRDRAGEVNFLAEQLVDIALVKLLNEVSSRKGKNSSRIESPDLFGDYRGIPKSVTICRGRKKSTSQLTILQADLWLKARSEKPDDDRHESFRRMVDDCRPFQQLEDDSLLIMIERKREAERLAMI